MPSAGLVYPTGKHPNVKQNSSLGPTAGKSLSFLLCL